jgi:hypothetical protein
MSRYDKVVPKGGTYRASLAAAFLQADIEKIFGVGHDSNGRLVIGSGQTGITAVLVLTKKQRAGQRVDPMKFGEIVEFCPTAGQPGVDVGKPGTVYYSDAAGNIVAGLDEVQTITATSGSSPIALSFNGVGPTANSGGNASTLTGAQVQTLLESLSNIDPGDVSVGGPAGGPWPVTFGGQYADVNVPAISGTNVTVGTGTPGGGTTGLVRVGHTVEGQRLCVSVEPA